MRVQATETRSYPAEAPVFTFEVPAGWTTEQGDGACKMLTCTAQGNGNIGYVVFTMTQPCSVEQFKVLLPNVARADHGMEDAADREVKPPREAHDETICGGAPFVFVVKHATVGGTRFVFSYFGFSPVPGRSYVIEQIVPFAEVKAHKEELFAVLRSIRLLP